MKFFNTLVIYLALVLTSSADRPPNIIYLMADELGYYELSHMGNPNIQTPYIDRFAQQGIRFTQALAGSSLCAPTRATLMTGKHSGHTSVRSNGGGTPLREGEPTIASMLKAKGYATGGFGKWGCGGRGSTGVPEKHGFDVFFGYYDQVHAHSYYTPYIIRNSEEFPLAGNKVGSNGETYSHYVIYQEALNFIQSNKDQPFFCYLPFTPPHGIFDIPDSDPAWSLYKDKSWPEQAKRYAAMVSMVDRQLGEIIQLLKRLEIDGQTIIFFCGDNGGADYFRDKDHPKGFHGANRNPVTGQIFRGQKGNLYEGGLRIPMLVRWPGKIAPGQVSDLLWYFPDVLPTISELTGSTPPKDIDGISIVPTLLGEKEAGHKQQEHSYLYWELSGQTAVRMGDWKLIQPNPKAEWELYDLTTDLSETTSVADKHPDIVATMKEFARKAHEPVVEGTFSDTTLHERDRQAKFGFSPPEYSGPDPMPTEGVVPLKEMKLARVSSENTANRKFATQTFDGNPATVWHSQFSPEIKKHPHEIVIDLGKPIKTSGCHLLSRQDGGWNGAIKDLEVYISNNPDNFAPPVCRAELKKTREVQTVRWGAETGRFICLRALSEVNGGPWTSIAELRINPAEKANPKSVAWA